MRVVRWLFGEQGVKAVIWLTDNILWYGIPIVIFSILYKYDPQKRIMNWLNNLWSKWNKTRFALPEEDRKVIDEYKARAKQKYSRNYKYGNKEKK